MDGHLTIVEDLWEASPYSFTTILGRFVTKESHIGVLETESDAKAISLDRLEMEARDGYLDYYQLVSTSS